MNDAGALVAGFYENFDMNDIDAAVRAFSEELETIDPGMGTVHGIEPFREYLETFKRAMPDARAIIEQQYTSGDTVIVEGRFVGTHTGSFGRRRRRHRADWQGRRSALRGLLTGKQRQDRLPTTPTTTRSASHQLGLGLMDGS